MKQKVNLLRPWRKWIAGQEVETAPHIAAQLIASGAARDASLLSVGGHITPEAKAAKPVATPGDEKGK